MKIQLLEKQLAKCLESHVLSRPDGYVLAITEECKAAFWAVIKALPRGVATPKIGTSSAGHIFSEWIFSIKNCNKVLTVMCDPKGEVYLYLKNQTEEALIVNQNLASTDHTVETTVLLLGIFLPYLPEEKTQHTTKQTKNLYDFLLEQCPNNE